MARTIVGRFESEADARRVAAALADYGIDGREMQVVDSESARQREQTWTHEHKGGGSFWSWLLGDVESESERGFPEADSRFYAEGLTPGAALLIVTTRDDQASRVASIMEQRGGDVQEGDERRERRPDVAGATSTGQGEQVLPVVEEQVRIGKRTVGRGNVRVYTHVTERPIEEHLRLREERIKVERRPVDQPITRVPAHAFEEQTIELTETAEEPVIEKQARVVEEVVVSKEVREREDTVRETARRTEVTVDRPDRDFSTVESEFRQHCTKHFGAAGVSYEECSPAYRYGYELGGRARGDWTAAEAEARLGWEQRQPGTWERFKESIRYAWDRARGMSRAA